MTRDVLLGMTTSVNQCSNKPMFLRFFRAHPLSIGGEWANVGTFSEWPSIRSVNLAAVGRRMPAHTNLALCKRFGVNNQAFIGSPGAAGRATGVASSSSSAPDSSRSRTRLEGAPTPFRGRAHPPSGAPGTQRSGPLRCRPWGRGPIRLPASAAPVREPAAAVGNRRLILMPIRPIFACIEDWAGALPELCGASPRIAAAVGRPERPLPVGRAGCGIGMARDRCRADGRATGKT